MRRALGGILQDKEHPRSEQVARPDKTPAGLGSHSVAVRNSTTLARSSRARRDLRHLQIPLPVFHKLMEGGQQRRSQVHTLTTGCETTQAGSEASAFQPVGRLFLLLLPPWGVSGNHPCPVLGSVGSPFTLSSPSELASTI